MNMDEAIHSLCGNCEVSEAELTGFLEQLRANMEESSYAPLSYVLNKRNGLRHAPMHTAIFAKNSNAVKVLIDFGADVNTKCHGTPATHLLLNMVALPHTEDFALKSLKLLLAADGVDVNAKDDQMMTLLHLAAVYNSTNALHLLLEYGAAASLETKDRAGMRPLHRAASRNAVDVAIALVAKGASLSAVTSYGMTPLHIAAASVATDTWKVLVDAGADPHQKDKFGHGAIDIARLAGCVVRGKLISRAEGSAAPRTTAIVTHPSCRQHYTCPPSETESTSAPPENIKRLAVLIETNNGSLRSADIAPKLKWVEEAPSATISDVLRVHEWSYIRSIQYVCEKIGSDAERANGIDSLDGDTTVSKKTFDAALHSAGAVIHAVDLVAGGSSRNAFCPIRPPGHHAGPRGLVKGGGPDSHGFCLVNNVSIGAAYALNVHRDKIKKVAIVDFDVHHGNGTEETVRWLNPGVEETKVVDPMAFGSLHMPRYKPWHGEADPQNVLFVSVHGYGPRERGLEHLMPQAAFYPGTGKTVLPDIPGAAVPAVPSSGSAPVEVPMQRDEEEEEEEEDDGDFDRDEDEDEDDDYSVDEYTPAAQGSGGRLDEMRHMYEFRGDSGLSLSRMPPLILDIGVGLPAGDDAGGLYRHQWRNYFRQEIFPRLMAFKPDMIFISAGFDAHRKDLINSGYIALVEEDFDWVTANLVRVANSCCEGRVVSALEGGYQTGGEFCSAFAQSVKVHVIALERGVANTSEYSQEAADRECSIERELIEDAEARRLAKIEAARKAEEERYAALAAQAEAGGGGGAEDSVAAAPSPDEQSSKKRRRTPVDYAALDKELNAKSN